MVMSWSDTALIKFYSWVAVFTDWDRNSERIVFYARPLFNVPGYTFALNLFVLIVLYGASMGTAKSSWSAAKVGVSNLLNHSLRLTFMLWYSSQFVNFRHISVLGHHVDVLLFDQLLNFLCIISVINIVCGLCLLLLSKVIFTFLGCFVFGSFVFLVFRSFLLIICKLFRDFSLVLSFLLVFFGICFL